MLEVTNNQPTPTVAVALELSLTKWVIGLSDGVKYSRQSVPARDLKKFHEVLVWFRQKRGLDDDARIVCVYEAGPDGFSVQRSLEKMGVECIVIDSASIEKSRHLRQAKSDNLDAEAMTRLLRRYLGGETRALKIVRVPPPEIEDLRELERERKRVQKEVNALAASICSLLLKHGIRMKQCDVKNLSPKDLDRLRTLDGRPLGEHLKIRLGRSLGRYRITLKQQREIHAERRALLKKNEDAHDGELDEQMLAQASQLMALKGVGEATAQTLACEILWRNFENRKEVGAAAGLCPTPYSSGSTRREQGISKAGNRHVRTLMIELSWLWLRHQPDSSLTKWFNERFGSHGRSKRIGIVALARKLLVALWRFAKQGVVPEGAVFS